jgi:hypothetical protein
MLIFLQRSLPGFHVKVPAGQHLKVDLLNEDKIQDTLEPQVKVLPLSINQIKDPSISFMVAISPRAQVAFGLPLAIQALQTSIGVTWDLIKIAISWTGKDNVDEKCKPATGPVALALAHGILIEIEAGFSAAFNLFGIILSTDILGNSVSPWGGLTYFKRTLYERCFRCGGARNEGCILQQATNILNSPINQISAGIADLMSKVVTEGFRILSHHSKESAQRKSARKDKPDYIEKGPGMSCLSPY